MQGQALSLKEDLGLAIGARGDTDYGAYLRLSKETSGAWPRAGTPATLGGGVCGCPRERSTPPRVL